MSKEKHPESCQFCLWEIDSSSCWAGDPTYLAEMEKIHYKEHCNKCPTCEQEIKSDYLK